MNNYTIEIMKACGSTILEGLTKVEFEQQLRRHKLTHTVDVIDDDYFVLYPNNKKLVTRLYVMMNEMNTSIHDIINANGRMGFEETKENIEFLIHEDIKEEKIHREQPVDIKKIDLKGFFTKYRKVNIEARDKYYHLGMQTMNYNQFIEYTKEVEILEATIVETSDTITIAVYVDNDYVLAESFRSQISEDLDNMVWSHGLDAFTEECPSINGAKLNDNPEFQICCAHKDKPVGNIGFYVQGEVLCASNMDLHSAINEQGKREFRNNVEREIICTKEEIDIDRHSHMEIILQNTKVLGIWVRDMFKYQYDCEVEELLMTTGLTRENVKYIQ